MKKISRSLNVNMKKFRNLLLSLNALALLYCGSVNATAGWNGYTLQYETDLGTFPSVNVSVSDTDSEATIESVIGSNTHVCFNAGDYTSFTLNISSSGAGSAAGSHKFLSLCGGDGVTWPDDMSSGARAVIGRVVFAGAANWSIRQLVFNPLGSGAGISWDTNASYLWFDRIWLNGAPNSMVGTLMVGTGDAENIVVQNSIIENTGLNPGTDLQGVKVRGDNWRIVHNIIRNTSGDAIQCDQNTGCDGLTIIENNYLYLTSGYWGDCDGSGHDTNDCSAGEDAIDFKEGAATNIYVLNNIMWGWKTTDTHFGSTNSFGYCVNMTTTSTFQITGVVVNGNICMSSAHGFSLGNDLLDNASVNFNISYDMNYARDSSTQTAPVTSEGFGCRQSDNSEMLFNMSIGDEYWFDTATNCNPVEVKGWIIIDNASGVVNDSWGASTEVDYNVFFNATEETTESPDHDLVYTYANWIADTDYYEGDMVNLSTDDTEGTGSGAIYIQTESAGCHSGTDIGRFVYPFAGLRTYEGSCVWAALLGERRFYIPDNYSFVVFKMPYGRLYMPPDNDDPIMDTLILDTLRAAAPSTFTSGNGINNASAGTFPIDVDMDGNSR